MNEEKLTLLQEEDYKVSKWLKETGYTDGDYMDVGFEPINGHQGRAMSFEYNGNIEELDVDKLATDIAENAIDDRFSVRVFVYDEEDGEAYRNMFCVEIWLNEEDTNEEIMKACATSALDFIDTVLSCMKQDGFGNYDIDNVKEYLLNAHEMHYNTDIGEQGESITNYIDSIKN